jgi:hypothetical protein
MVLTSAAAAVSLLVRRLWILTDTQGSHRIVELVTCCRMEFMKDHKHIWSSRTSKPTGETPLQGLFGRQLGARIHGTPPPLQPCEVGTDPRETAARI